MRHASPVESSSAFTARFAAAFLLLAAPTALAQQGPLKPWVGERGITETVDQIMARDRVERPNRPPFAYRGIKEEFEVEREDLPQDPGSLPVPRWPIGDSGETRRPGAPSLPQTVGRNFLATEIGDTIGYVPPDTVGAVGPTQILVCSNGVIKVLDKTTGATGALNTSTDTFFNSVRNGSSTSDPQVKYDRLTSRWFVTIINVASASNRILLAVSSGPTITGAGSFTFYFMQHDLVSPPGDTGDFADYPKTGIDSQAIYIGIDMFATTLQGTTGFVIQKASVLSGGPIVATAFRGLATTGGSGPFAPTGVDNDDPASTDGYFVGTDIGVYGRLVLRRVSNPGGTPSISGDLNLTVPTTTGPLPQVALGSGTPLDALDDRLFAAQIHLNRATGLRTLWTSHNIEVDDTGVGGTGGGRNGSRWYEIGSLPGTPALIQSGTLFDSAVTPRGFWIPSVAMSGQGHMAIGASYAGPSDMSGCAVAGRLAGDTLGTTQAATIAQPGASTYNIVTIPPTPSQRWGDYSAVMVDPSDDQTLWAFIEYANSTDSWGVRAIELRAPPPVTPASATPALLNPGDPSVNIVITGTSAAGSAFYDTEPGIQRIAAAFSGAGITVNSITRQSDTQVTVNVAIDVGAANGLRDVTITNPDGQTASSTGGILSVGPDCNHNGVLDSQDISGGGSQDANANGIPDECETDFSAFCFPDVGGVRSCPCNNPPVPALSAKGCDNYVNTTTVSGTGGAQLAVTGTANASVSNTLVFHVTLAHNPGSNTNLHVFWKGTSTNVTGVKSGFGVRCVAGTLKRIYQGSGTGTGGLGSTNAVDFPNGTQTTDAWTASQMPGSGTTLYYYDSFRDQQGPTNCLTANDRFNVSHAGSVTWSP